LAFLLLLEVGIALGADTTTHLAGLGCIFLAIRKYVVDNDSEGRKELLQPNKGCFVAVSV
jgi:hypothetical protein